MCEEKDVTQISTAAGVATSHPVRVRTYVFPFKSCRSKGNGLHLSNSLMHRCSHQYVPEDRIRCTVK